MCRGAVELLARLALVPRSRLAAFQTFEEPDAGRLLDAGVHNELAVIHLDTREVRTGVEGLLWALEGSWASVLLILARPAPVRAALGLAYRLIAYNRRILSPVRTTGIRCACDPDFRLSLRVGFILLALLAAGSLGLLVLGKPGPQAAGIGVLLAASLARTGPARADALAHAAWVGLLATLAAVPAGLLDGQLWWSLPALALLTSAWRRNAAVGLSRVQATVLVLVAGGAAYLTG